MERTCGEKSFGLGFVPSRLCYGTEKTIVIIYFVQIYTPKNYLFYRSMAITSITCNTHTHALWC